MKNKKFYDARSLLMSKLKQILNSLQQLNCFCQQNFSTLTCQKLFEDIQQISELVNKKIRSIIDLCPQKTEKEYKELFQKKFNQFKFLSIQDLNGIKYIVFWCPKHGAQQISLNNLKFAKFVCCKCNQDKQINNHI